MVEKPVLFRDDMVQAILDGRKNVTRRVGSTWSTVKPGTLLWVREAWCPCDADSSAPTSIRTPFLVPADLEVYYRADVPEPELREHIPYRPSIHMPRWASRLTLEVVSVTEERALLGGGLGQFAVLMPKVDDPEARREGFADRAAFLAAWRKMHPDYTGPVYRIEFRRVPRG